MVTFFVCLAILILGYIVYGTFVEKVFKPDDRPTPCVAHPDGVDYVPIKPGRAFLIQLLNIAGLGAHFWSSFRSHLGAICFTLDRIWYNFCRRRTRFFKRNAFCS